MKKKHTRKQAVSFPPDPLPEGMYPKEKEQNKTHGEIQKPSTQHTTVCMDQPTKLTSF